MIYGVYAMFDKKTGFMTPTIEQNDAVAIRNFFYALRKNDYLGVHYSDLELYKLGSFDNDLGILTGIDKVLLAEGRKVENDN